MGRSADNAKRPPDDPWWDAEAPSWVGRDQSIRCMASSQQQHRRCRRPVAPGCPTCRHHGSSTSAALAAGQRNLEQQRIDGAVGELMAELNAELADDQHPVASLAEADRRARLMVAVWSATVASLDSLLGPDHLGDVRAHPADVRLGYWNEQVARISKLALDAGVDAKRLELQGSQVAQLVGVVRDIIAGFGAIMREVGVDPTLAESVVARVPGMVSNVVRQLEAGDGGQQ